MSFPPHSLSAPQLAALREAERAGTPFLAFRDGEGGLRIQPLEGAERLTLGRAETSAIALPWDPQVSRTHAQLELVGSEWTLVDDGLSRNGSFVNGERITGRRRLDDGDVARIGATTLLFRAPGLVGGSTEISSAATVAVTAAQRRVLVALCRPLAVDGTAAVPASNREIADELHLSLAGVKTHIRALFAALGVDELPQYRKRTELARRALDLGLVTSHDARP